MSIREIQELLPTDEDIIVGEIQTTIMIEQDSEPFLYFYETSKGNKLVRWSDWYDNNTIEEIN